MTDEELVHTDFTAVVGKVIVEREPLIGSDPFARFIIRCGVQLIHWAVDAVFPTPMSDL